MFLVDKYKGQPLLNAMLKQECAKPLIDSSVLYMVMATPSPLKLYTSKVWAAPPSSGWNVTVNLPFPLVTKSVARYWSPNAWRPIMIGAVQLGTKRGTLAQTIGSRKTVPSRMLRIVPLGDFHICFKSNSATRASSGVMVAHLIPTPYFLIASAASIVTWSFVSSRYSTPKS